MTAFGAKWAAPLVAVLGVAFGAFLAAPAMGAAIAKAVDVRPEATGLSDGGTVVLSAADDLFEGQTIVTGARGQVQIVFADDTRMVVGPGSTLVIETYLMRNNGTASAFAVSALGGSFRFITGKSNKSAYKIDTPTGTIGVRGTKFDFTVSKRKTDIVIFEGEVNYCANSGSCESVNNRCEVGSGTSSGTTVSSNGGADNFIYVKSQSSLGNGFKVNGAGACGDGPAQTEAREEPRNDPAPSKPEGRPDPIPDPLPGQ